MTRNWKLGRLLAESEGHDDAVPSDDLPTIAETVELVRHQRAQTTAPLFSDTCSVSRRVEHGAIRKGFSGGRGR